ncbi:MAG: ATP-binding protein [bacterium]
MRLTVRKKLFLATGIVFVLVIMVSMVGIWSIWRVGMGISLVEDHCTINRCWNADTIRGLKISFEKTISPVRAFAESGTSRECIIQFDKAAEQLVKDMEEAMNMAESLNEPRYILLNSSLNNVRKEILEVISLSGQILAKPGFMGDATGEKVTGRDVKPDSLPDRDADLMMQRIHGLSAGVINQLNSILNYYAEDTRATLEKANRLRFDLAAAMVLIFFLLALAILGSGFLLARGITTPIQKLVQATQRVASGELTCKVPISSLDEIGELAQHFNAMTEDLQKYQNKLLANERLATLGTFVSYVSHELRNPLSVLKNGIFFLETQSMYDEATFRKYFKMMREEIDIARKIIDDCLSFARERKLDLKAIDINILVEKAFTLTDIPDHIQIKKEFCSDLPSLMVDKNQILQVLTNVIINAVAAMNKEGTLTIITRRGQDYDEVIFTDTGPGIPQQNLKKLFDPFFTTKSKGTGLGLAICKYIVENHGGLIWAENIKGRGASFYIRLPLEPARKLIDHHHEETLALS